MPVVAEYRIQGQIVDSMAEYYFGIALEKLDYEFHYQWAIGLGGTAGSVSVDYVIYAPTSIPVEIHGKYFHPDPTNDAIRDSIIREYFKMDPIIIDAAELFSITSAMVKVKAVLP